MLNIHCRLACLLCVTLIAKPVLSQDISGWSDKTICRLAANQPDETLYQQEVITRVLDCADYKVVKPSIVTPKNKNKSAGSSY
jgi:predicted type IV restriction endonuclease